MIKELLKLFFLILIGSLVSLILFYLVDCQNYKATSEEEWFRKGILMSPNVYKIEVDKCSCAYWNLHLYTDTLTVKSDSIAEGIFLKIKNEKPKGCNFSFLRVHTKKVFVYRLGWYSNEVQKRYNYCIEC